MEQELLTLPEHLSSRQIFSVFVLLQFLFFICFWLPFWYLQTVRMYHCLSFFFPFDLAIVLSALGFTASNFNYHFSVLKLFFQDLFKLFHITHIISVSLKSVPSLESGLSCTCVLVRGIYFAFFYDFSVGFGNVSTIWYIQFFILFWYKFI